MAVLPAGTPPWPPPHYQGFHWAWERSQQPPVLLFISSFVEEVFPEHLLQPWDCCWWLCCPTPASQDLRHRVKREPQSCQVEKCTSAPPGACLQSQKAICNVPELLCMHLLPRVLEAVWSVPVLALAANHRGWPWESPQRDQDGVLCRCQVWASVTPHPVT